MAGFENDVLVCKNMNFDETAAKPRLGIIDAAGKFPIGTGSTFPTPEILAGSITSPGGSVTVGYSSPNITLEIGAESATTFDTDSGTATPNLNVLKVFGGTGIDTSAVGNTITIAVEGGSVGQTITGQSGGALSPTAGNWNISGASTAAGASPVVTSGSSSTLTVNVQKSQALAATDATKIGLSNFDSTSFAVDANGFVTLAGAGFTWSDVSGAFSPLKNNGYFITGTATGTLPAAPAQGDTIKFFVDHASQVLTIQATAGKIIRFGSLVSSAAGTFVSTLQGDSVELTYRTSDTCWCAIAGFSGTWTFT